MRKVFLIMGILVAGLLSAQSNERPDFKAKGNKKPKSENVAEQKNDQINDCDGSNEEFGPRGEGPEGRHFGKRTPPPFEFMKDLNDEQKQKLKALHKENFKLIAPLRNEIELKRAELRYLENGENPSIDEISKKLDEIGQVEKKLKLEEIKFHIKIKKEFESIIGK